MLAAITFLVQLLWPSRAWMILLILLGGAWLFSFFWARSLKRSLRLERDMRYGWAQVGDRLQERFILSNGGWAPCTWVEVRDESTLPGSQIGRVTGVGSFSIQNWKTERVCTHRGLFTLGPTRLRTGDPLNIYSVETFLPNSTVLMVMPPVIPLPSIEIAPGGRFGTGRRARRQSIETTVSVEGVYEYAPGEPLKAIHWPTSARRGKFFVRQFEHTPASDWWIFLDLQASAQAGHDFDSTEEDGVILAASLTHKGLQEGHPVGMAINSQTPVWLPPLRSPDQRLDVLRALALVNPGNYSMAQFITAQQPALGKGASLILVTPDVTAEWLPSLLLLRRLGISPTVLLLDPSSYGGASGAVRVAEQMVNYGIPCHVITHELLDLPEAHPGSQGTWEWRIIGLGKAVPVRQPKDMTWRRLE